MGIVQKAQLRCRNWVIIGGGPTTFLYMATRFLPNVHVQNVQKCTKYVFSCLEVPWIDLLAVANLQ